MRPTLPNGTKPPGTPAWWPFGTLKPSNPTPPVDVRIPLPRAPRAPLPAEPAPY